jgi:hypothetical protein
MTTLLGLFAIAVKFHVAAVLRKAEWSRLGLSMRSQGNEHRLDLE